MQHVYVVYNAKYIYVVYNVIYIYAVYMCFHLADSCLFVMQMIFHSRPIAIVLLVDMVALLMYNFSGMCVTGTTPTLSLTLLVCSVKEQSCQALMHHVYSCPQAGISALLSCRKERKNRKDYAFRRQFNEKPSIISGFPGLLSCMSADAACGIENMHVLHVAVALASTHD